MPWRRARWLTRFRGAHCVLDRYVVWRLHKFGVLTYQDPGCKEVAHIVIEKTLASKYRFRNNAKQEGFETVQDLLSSRKYLNPSISIDDINVMAGDGTAAPAPGGVGAGAGTGAGAGSPGMSVAHPPSWRGLVS